MTNDDSDDVERGDWDLSPIEWELDFCTFLNMQLGMDYRTAKIQARQDMKDSRE